MKFAILRELDTIEESRTQIARLLEYKGADKNVINELNYEMSKIDNALFNLNEINNDFSIDKYINDDFENFMLDWEFYLSQLADEINR